MLAGPPAIAAISAPPYSVQFYRLGGLEEPGFSECTLQWHVARKAHV